MYRYLMVHDLVWMNTTIGGAIPRFDYARLEAVVAAQYDFGPQRPIAQVAASVIDAVRDLRPFEQQNEGTAFLAAAVLLATNGCSAVMEPGPATDALVRAAMGQAPAAAALADGCGLGEQIELPNHGPLRHLVAHLVAANAAAVEQLSKRGTTQNV